MPTNLSVNENSNNILSLLKEYIYSLVDNNGNFRTLPIGEIGKRKLTEDRLKMLQELVKFLRDTNFFNDAGRIYVFNRRSTIKDVHEEIGDLARGEGRKPPSFSTVKNKIDYCRDKFTTTFGAQTLYDITHRIHNENKLKAFKLKIIECYKKYGYNDDAILAGRDKNSHKSINDNILLNLNVGEVNESVDVNKLKEYIFLIKPYLNNVVNELTDKLNTEYQDCISYIEYLTYCPSLTADETKIMSNIQEWLGEGSLTEEIDDTVEGQANKEGLISEDIEDITDELTSDDTGEDDPDGYDEDNPDDNEDDNPDGDDDDNLDGDDEDDIRELSDNLDDILKNLPIEQQNTINNMTDIQLMEELRHKEEEEAKIRDKSKGVKTKQKHNNDTFNQDFSDFKN